MRMAAVGSVIPNYMAAPQGVGYSDKAVKPQDLGAWETFKGMPNFSKACFSSGSISSKLFGLFPIDFGAA